MKRGLVVVLLEKLFGRSWRTSIYGTLAVLPQIANLVQQYGVSIGVPKSILDGITLVFAIITVISTKDKAVHGYNRDENTGVKERRKTDATTSAANTEN